MATVVKKCGDPRGKWRTCRHPWIVRYRTPEGVQRETTYLWDQKKLANDFSLKVEHDKRAGVFRDPKAPDIPFGAYAEKMIREGRLSTASRKKYSSVLREHLGAIADRGLRDVATDRDGIRTLLTTDLPASGASPTTCETAKVVITATLREAITAGHVVDYRLRGIKLNRAPVKADFHVPTHEQCRELAEKMGDLGLAVWLARGCGLRIQEALGVSREDFRECGTVLRVHEQAEPSGRGVKPLKHRKPGDYRDVPVPGYVWEAVKAKPSGRLFRGVITPLPQYNNFWRAFNVARKDVGLPDTFTFHDLRHVFASVTLSRGVPITDVAEWLGHKNIQVTYGIYGHLVPSAVGRAREVLDEEWQEDLEESCTDR